MTGVEVNYLTDPKTGTIIPYQIKDGEKLTVIEPGVYEMDMVAMGMMSYTLGLNKLNSIEKLISFEGSIVEEAVKTASKFLSDESVQAYKELALCHKLGLLLEGPHGTGKTCTALLIMKKLAEKHNAICIDCTKFQLNDLRAMVKQIREHQSNPILAFVDEFESRMYEEYKWLTFLDGVDSVEGFIFVGCTNYMSKISKRLVDRKSRIKRVFHIDGLPDAVYKKYIAEKLPHLDKIKLEEFAYLAVENKLVIDQVKNAVIDFKLEGYTIKKCIAVAKKLSSDPTASEIAEDDEDAPDSPDDIN